MNSKFFFPLIALITVFTVHGQRLNIDSLYMSENYKNGEHLITSAMEFSYIQFFTYQKTIQKNIPFF